MKTISTTIRALAATAAWGALGTIANAGPGIQHWKSPGTEPQSREVKPGRSATYVCNECKTSSNKSHDQFMSYCKAGPTVTCPSCKTQPKMVRKTARNQAGTHTVVAYVNQNGKECIFFAKPSEKK